MIGTPLQCFGRCNALAVRLERIVHLDSMLVDWHFFAPTRSELEEELSDLRGALLDGGLEVPGLETANTIDDLEDALYNVAGDTVPALGFLVKARQPYFQIEGERLGYSWEVSRSQWFHALTFEDAIEKACIWGQAFHDEAWTRARGRR
ncbi:hypothetical protein [Paraburkholderia caledonica]|jgi:hypothetical protein|uniref:hypothetical protein n=1 Tax=Paraburkholderia caledonica TaxID=134536 RepID=UPI000488645E|nr:hypothetical protein [Paraburkholderia caledonica]